MTSRTQEERTAIRQGVIDTLHLSLRKAAEQLGLSHQRVSQYRKELREEGADPFVGKKGYTRSQRMIQREEAIRRVLDAGGTIKDAVVAAGGTVTTVGHQARDMGYLPCRWLKVDKVAEQYR